MALRLAAVPSRKSLNTMGLSIRFVDGPNTILGYFFQVFHRPARMMRGVDGLTRPYDKPLITQHLKVALQLYTANRAARLAVYDPPVFHSHNPFKCLSTAPSIVPVPPLCLSVPTATTYPYHSIMTNLPLRFSPSPGPLLANTCSTISPTSHPHW